MERKYPKVGDKMAIGGRQFTVDEVFGGEVVVKKDRIVWNADGTKTAEFDKDGAISFLRWNEFIDGGRWVDECGNVAEAM